LRVEPSGERTLKMKRIFLIALLAAGITGEALAIPPAPWEADELIGKNAPGFTLPDLSGKDVSLKDFKGKVVVVNFWATWCPPCRMEIPGMNDLYNKYQDQGLVILGISSDPSKPMVERFMEKNPIAFTVLHDPENRVGEKDYKVYSLPMSFIVDRDGVLVRKIFGAYEWNSDESFSLFGKLLKTGN